VTDAPGKKPYAYRKNSLPPELKQPGWLTRFTA